MRRRIPQLGTKFYDIDAGLHTMVVQAGQDIQSALDSVAITGGKVFLKNGFHSVSSNITMYSNVIIEGETTFGTIIDFGGGPYSFIIQGSTAYETGTVSVTKGSTIVVGSGTTWDNSMIGEYVLIDGDYYYISDINTTSQQLILSSGFSGQTQSGLSYTITNPINGVGVRNLTVQNSSAQLFIVKYYFLVLFENVDCGFADIGFDVQNGTGLLLVRVDIGNMRIGLYFNKSFAYSLDNFFVYNCSSNGIEASNGGDSTILNFGVSNCGGKGIKMVNESKVGFLSFTISDNTSDGVELNAGCSKHSFIGGVIESNGASGIKITATSDNNIVNSVQIMDNVSYGIQIANANCDNNIIVSNILSNNTAGSVSNSGTGTKIRSNIGVSDN